MNLREHNPHEQQRPAGDSGPPASGELAALQAQSQEFLTAGSAILKSALSQNSEAYVSANRQQGGE